MAARRATRKEGLERFAVERREAYEQFYEAIKKQLKADQALHALLETHRKEGKTDMSDEERANFPPSGMAELASAFEQIRRLARNYAMIRSAEAILRLFLDMTRSLRAALDDPGPDDKITWFLLQRFLDERIDEFVHSYREDLGIGRPAGAPKNWPIIQREFLFGFDLAQSEETIRAHIPIKILPKPSKESSVHQEGHDSNVQKPQRLTATENDS